jgi:modification methylase
MIFPQDFIDRIIVGDCLDVMRQMPDACVDLVVTSPPYNIKNTTGGGFPNDKGKWQSAGLREGYDGYDDCMPHDEYAAWQRECLTQMMRLIKNTGAIFYNHKWRVQDGRIQDRQDIVGTFPVRQIIIWKRSGGINFSPRFFLPTYEVIYLITKPDFKIVPGTCNYTDVWTIGQELKNDHPAPFPIEIPDRAIRSSGAKIVLDPFMGSGTTAVACKQIGVNFIGIEKSERYATMATERVNKPFDVSLFDV